jgi:hypothetical protein
LEDVEHVFDPLADVVGCDVLVDLDRDNVFIGEVDLDDLFDRPINRPAEQFGDLHAMSPLGTIRARYP